MSSDRTQWLLVALVFLAGLLAAAQFGKIALTLPEVARTFARPLTGVSVLVSLVGLVGLVFGAMAGGVAAGFGPGRTFLGGLVLGGVLSLVQVMPMPFWAFAATRVVEGMSHLALVVGGPPLMAAAASDRDRPLVMGLWALFFGGSLAISAQVFPAILGTGGLALLFGLHGAAMLVLAAMLWRRVPRIPRQAVSLDPVATHAAIYSHLRRVAPALGFVCYTFLFVACVAILPEALSRPSLAFVLPLITLTTTLAGGALCRRFRPDAVVAAGFAGTALGLGGAALGLPGAVEAALAFMGLIPGASFAAIPALNDTPQDRALATGAIAQLGNLGTMSGTPVLALVWVQWGTTTLICSAAASACAGLAIALWTGRRLAGGRIDAGTRPR